MRVVEPNSISHFVGYYVTTSAGVPVDVAYNESGISLWYQRAGADKVSIPPAARTKGAVYSATANWVHISDGHHEMCAPNAAFVAGAKWVQFGGTDSKGNIYYGERISLDSSVDSVLRKVRG